MKKYYGSFSGDRLLAMYEDPTPEDVAAMGLEEITGEVNAGPRPTPFHELWRQSGQLVWKDPRSIEQAKNQKRAQIDEWRLQAHRSGFVYQGRRVATDEMSFMDLIGTNGRISRRGSLPANWPGGWKSGGQIIPIATVEQWDDFYEAMYQQGLSNFFRSQALKTQVDSAQTIEEIEAITWETNEPSA